MHCMGPNAFLNWTNDLAIGKSGSKNQTSICMWMYIVIIVQRKKVVKRKAKIRNRYSTTPDLRYHMGE